MLYKILNSPDRSDISGDDLLVSQGVGLDERMSEYRSTTMANSKSVPRIQADSGK